MKLYYNTRDAIQLEAIDILLNLRYLTWVLGRLTHSAYNWNNKWQKCARMGLNSFHIKWMIGTHCNWKNQNPGSTLGATSKTALPIQPIYLKFGPNWPNWHCCLAGSSQGAPRILIFSIAMGANYTFYVKSIEIQARAFLPLNKSSCK